MIIPLFKRQDLRFSDIWGFIFNIPVICLHILSVILAGKKARQIQNNQKPINLTSIFQIRIMRGKFVKLK